MTDSKSNNPFKPALLVIDMQEDFCPPEGSLAIAGGREIAPLINNFLSLPFTLKIATQDFHPDNHISFASSHSPPNIKAFESSVIISNPYNEGQSHSIPIWPVHCVQNTKGAEIILEIDAFKFHHVVKKGMDSRVEMFSGFADVFGNKSRTAASMDLAELLKETEITHVFCVGLAGDHCVRCTALDATKEGLEVFVIEEATRSANDGESGWMAAKAQFEKAGVKVIHADDVVLDRVRNLS